jgi:predicted KAP-like P-loop ATPase
MTLDASRGLVVGVLGAWGSGKTSFINLARPEFTERATAVIDFNPWMFSGSALIDAFFIEISAQLKVKPGLSSVGESLENYGEVLSGFGWVPFVGPWVDRVRLVAGSTGKLMKKRRGGSQDARRKISTVLTKLEKPIVVILDDVDRLSTAEIRGGCCMIP